MKQNTTTNFYLKISLWTFLCLFLASFYSAVREMTKSSNESSAVQTIEMIVQLQNQYPPKRHGSFAPNFYELVKVENLDEKFAADYPVIDGYVFALKVSESDKGKWTFYSITADPLYPQDNLRHFYYDSTLETIRVTEENRPANAADPSI